MSQDDASQQRAAPAAFTVDVCGLQLAARAWGPADGMPVLALHGWMDNAASFDALAPLLSKLRLVALDITGHGWSEHRPAGAVYHFVDAVSDVALAAEALGWSSYALLGHSMGAGIATLLAGCFPERITHLMLIEGLGPMSTPARDAPNRLRRAVMQRTALQQRSSAVYPSRRAMVDRLREALPDLTENAATTLVERGSRPVAGGVTWRADPRLRGISPHRLTEPTVQAYLRAVDAPALLIRGRASTILEVAEVAERREAIAHLEDVTLEGGHHLHLTHPQPVATAIEGFLGRHQATLAAEPQK